MLRAHLNLSLAIAATTLTGGGVAANANAARGQQRQHQLNLHGDVTPLFRQSMLRQLLHAADTHSYKASWPECCIEGQELNGAECKHHIEHDINENTHVLQGHVDVEVIVFQDSYQEKANEVLIQTNRHGDVIGSGGAKHHNNIHDGWIRYDFLWYGAKVGPFDCAGHSFASCCGEIRRETQVDEALGKSIGCHRQEVYPTATVDASTDDLYISEYVYNHLTKEVQRVNHVQDQNETQSTANAMHIQIQEGADGKVCNVPALDLQVIHENQPARLYESESAPEPDDSPAFVITTDTLKKSVSGAGVGTGADSGAEAFFKGATSSFQTWWLGIPLGFLAFSVCFCCTALYVLCCIPIKDEDYLKDTEKALEEVTSEYEYNSPGDVTGAAPGGDSANRRDSIAQRQTASSSQLM
jgi:hypothetical protein